MTDWIKGLFISVDEMDTEKFLSFLAEDSQFRFGNMDAVHGKGAIRKAVDDFFGMIKGLSHNIINVWEVKDAVICQGDVTYTKKDNSKVTLPFCNVFGMKEGKVKDYLVYVDVGPLFQ